MIEVETSLQEYWDDVRPPDSERRPSVRPGSIHPSWNPPDVDKAQAWAASLGEGTPKPFLLVEGPTPAHRASIYRLTKTLQDQASTTWLDEGIVENLTARFSKVRAIGSIIPHEWDLLWNLLTLEQVEFEEPLRLLIDQGLVFTEAFKAIWEARSRLDEGREIKNLVTAISRWMTGVKLAPAERRLLGSLGIERELGTPFERLDMLFFLVTLAKQNDLVAPLVLILDGLDRVVTLGVSRRKVMLKELYDFCLAAERWSRLEAPIGFMLGYSDEHRALDAIERANSKLGTKLKSYLV
jgi:hypothetical protein